MGIRKMMLPEGWYPHHPETAEKMIRSWNKSTNKINDFAAGGFGPHAGWFFSGELSWKLVQNIPRDTELIIIAGGHLSAGQNHKLLNFNSFETPFGLLTLDEDAACDLCSGFTDDFDIDNTVEIYLPLVKFLFPDARILPVRLAPSERASSWAGNCAVYCRENQRKAFFLGSTDLSHYGSRFLYTSYGRGASARSRVRSLDEELLHHLGSLDFKGALEDVDKHQSACSVGAAVGAGAFSQEMESRNPRILDHYYSYDIIDDSDSFVGYGAMVYT